jgi:hypothetical protein
MAMNPLPPQAYTKETLGKAFAWLQAQPENLKEFATSPDILVSLYLKAKLNGEGALERPSIQNFKNELKSLAGMMGDFEVMEPAAASEAFVGAAATRAQIDDKRFSDVVTERQPETQVRAPSSSPAQSPLLDVKSKAMISETMEAFNLSSESEALRLLISSGHKALKRI